MSSPPRATTLKAFWAVLYRDLYVTSKELVTFLAQVILQPLFLLFVFGKILIDLGYASPEYAELLFPGLVGLTAVVTGLQSSAFPLVIDFAYTKEIEDRLLAPLPTDLVALEKIIYSALRALVASILMIPIGMVVLGSIPFRTEAAPLFLTVIILGCLVGSTMGLLMGTSVTAGKINIVFSLVFTPLLFTGSSQYPWPALDHMRWFQVVTALNPLTYVSEGLRAAMVPQVPHIPVAICLGVLVMAIIGIGWGGILGFRKRALD